MKIKLKHMEEEFLQNYGQAFFLQMYWQPFVSPFTPLHLLALQMTSERIVSPVLGFPSSNLVFPVKLSYPHSEKILDKSHHVASFVLEAAVVVLAAAGVLSAEPLAAASVQTQTCKRHF